MPVSWHQGVLGEVGAVLASAGVGSPKTLDRCGSLNAETLKLLGEQVCALPPENGKQVSPIDTELDQYALEHSAAETDQDIPLAIARFVKTVNPNFRTLSIKDAAALLGVAPNTLKARIRRGKVLAWKGVKTGHLIPEEQFTECRTVLAGIEDVIRTLGDPEIAWTFLARQHPFDDIVERPLDRLKRGLVDDVISTANGYGTDFT